MIQLNYIVVAGTLACLAYFWACFKRSDNNDQEALLKPMYWYRTEFVRKEIEQWKIKNPDKNFIPIDEEDYITSQHYLGSSAVLNAMREVRIPNKPSSRYLLLDAGGGLGGSSRIVSSKNEFVNIVSIDFNDDFTSIARNLTASAGMNHTIFHETADLLNNKYTGKSYFDAAMSLLCILHIPDKGALFKSIASMLKMNAYFYIEDLILHSNSPVSDQDKDMMEKVVAFALPIMTEEAYKMEIINAGFQIVAFHDMTDSWSQFTKERFDRFMSNIERQNQLHGEEVTEQYRKFFNVTYGLLSRSILKGIRLTVKKVDSI